MTGTGGPDSVAATTEVSDANNSHRRSVTSIKSSNSLEVAFAQRDEYVYSIVQNMVDNVCLHAARVEAVKREHKNSKAAAADEENNDDVDGNEAL